MVYYNLGVGVGQECHTFYTFLFSSPSSLLQKQQCSREKKRWINFIFIDLFIFCLFIFGCIGSSLLRAGFLQLWRAEATLRGGARASYCDGFSCCRAWALGTRAQQLWLASSRVQAQQLWCTGLVTTVHVGSSRTRARTRVPCIGRRILNQCATREA